MNNNKRILLIGDDTSVLKTLRRMLRNQGYTVLLALDDQDAYEMTASFQPHLFIINLDFAYTSVNGLEICNRLRRISKSPLMVLFSTCSEKIRNQIMNLGADEYLTLPFNEEMFLARVRSLVWNWIKQNKNLAKSGQQLIIRDLLIDVASQKVQFQGENIHLTPKEYDLLFNLAVNPGQIISHYELAVSLWGEKNGEKIENLRDLIWRLRKKIEDNPLKPHYILSKPGVGYRLMAEAN